MKNNCLILLILLSLAGCGTKKVRESGSGSTDSAGPVHSGLKDTVYVQKEPSIVPEDLYLNLDSIKSGAPFTDRSDNYGYYRLLFSSSEETQSFHIEKIKIVFDGIVKLEKRFEIPPRVFGFENDFSHIVLIRWQAPEIIELIVDGKRMVLDITSLKATEIE